LAKDIPISLDTQAALQAAVAACGSARRWARAHGLSPALVSDVLNGHHEDVGIRTENRVRAALGLPPVPPRLPAACCPDCLARGVEVVHGDGLRCHGKGAEGIPVVLAPDERVIRRGNGARRKRYLRLAVDGDALPEGAAAAWRALTPRRRADLIAEIIKNGGENGG
jgi:hypothetical protein